MSRQIARTLAELQERLEYRFSDTGLLQQALVHRSWLNEVNDPTVVSNERLEYLGDAALNAFVSRRLYEDFPTATEGWLTMARSILVRNESLAAIGQDLRLAGCLLLGSGIANDGGAESVHVLSCALEAVVGAVWLDGGDPALRRVVGQLMGAQIASLSPHESLADAKSQLQHHTQQRNGSKPIYRIVRTDGPVHERTFVAEVAVDGLAAATGEGRSKQAAEMEAARLALRLLNVAPDS